MAQPLREPTVSIDRSRGDPVPLGLAAFGLSAVAAGMVLSGRWPHSAQDFLVLVPLLLIFGGIVQFIAGMWSYARGQTLAALFFGSFGSLFATTALYGIVAAGHVVQSTPGVFGPVAVALACFCFIALVVCVGLRDTPGFSLASLALAVSLFFLAWSLFAKNDQVLTAVGGWAGFIAGVFALGTAGMTVMGDLAVPVQLPGVGRLGHRPPAVGELIMPDPYGTAQADPGQAEPRPVPEPLVGWRLWRVRGEQLRAWMVDYTWSPGPNKATCLDPRPCPSSPGRGCKCGFWATASLRSSMLRARGDRSERHWVLGLMRGWGEVAVHGEEGFRAACASIVCLFVDWPWGPTSAGWLPGWTSRFLETIGAIGVRPAPVRFAELRTAACCYGVPLLTIREGLETGVIAEFGLGDAARAEAREVVQT